MFYGKACTWLSTSVLWFFTFIKPRVVRLTNLHVLLLLFSSHVIIYQVIPLWNNISLSSQYLHFTQGNLIHSSIIVWNAVSFSAFNFCHKPCTLHVILLFVFIFYFRKSNSVWSFVVRSNDYRPNQFFYWGICFSFWKCSACLILYTHVISP